MAGTIIPVFTKRTFDFSNLGSSATAEYVMVKSLDVSQWTSVSLWIRVHSNSIAPDDAEIQVVVYPTDPSAEEPSVDFVDSDTYAYYAVQKSTAAPGLLGLNISSISDGFVRISVKGVQGSTPGTSSADLSVDVVAKAKG